ncbi:MAG TPA: hypothetical protein VLE19_03885 [Pyrinomonadaceae bacterium]|nr:hypothetical protein [Pyrinomonadaceae bacterium]
MKARMRIVREKELIGEIVGEPQFVKRTPRQAEMAITYLTNRNQDSVREADERIKPGVKRSGTPGEKGEADPSPRGRQFVDFLELSRWNVLKGCRPLRGLAKPSPPILGLTPQATCFRPLRGLNVVYDSPSMSLPLKLIGH